MQTLETRSFEVRDINLDAREVTGLAVPYDMIANNEMFAQGAAIPAENTMLFWEHDDPIGRIVAWEQTAEGLMITARFTEGVSQADEAYALVKDGVIRSFSVGFRLIESHLDANGVNVVDLADVREVSVVPFPWYETAKITQVREEPTESVMETENMTDSIPAVAAADLDEVREAVEDIRREVAVALETRMETAPVVDTRSAGEVLHAVIKGDEQAIRTYSGATTADSVLINAWVGDLTRLVEQAAPLRNTFASGVLPAAGNFIEYATLTSNTVALAAQAAEGDDLNAGVVTIDSHTAAVSTYGGVSTLSKQVIERSSIAYLDHVLRAQAIAAGVQINSVIKTAYEAEHAAQVTASNKVTFGKTTWAAGTYQDWIAAAIDAQIKFQALGLPISALVVSSAVFKNLMNVTTTDGRPVFLVSGNGVNNIGSLNVTGLSGDLASIPVVVDASLATDKVAFVNSNALRFYGSGVVQLQQEKVLNLTKDFGVYMYGATAHEIPAAIVPVVRASS